MRAYLNEIIIAMLVIFNGGALVRLAINKLNAADEETIDYNSRNKKLLKVIVIVDSFSSIVALIKGYFM